MGWEHHIKEWCNLNLANVLRGSVRKPSNKDTLLHDPSTWGFFDGTEGIFQASESGAAGTVV